MAKSLERAIVQQVPQMVGSPGNMVVAEVTLLAMARWFWPKQGHFNKQSPKLQGVPATTPVFLGVWMEYAETNMPVCKLDTCCCHKAMKTSIRSKNAYLFCEAKLGIPMVWLTKMHG